MDDKIDARPTTIEEVQEITRQAARLLPRGGGTKPALSGPREGVQALDMSALAGIVEYEAGELTFTALAGTRLSEVNKMLAEHNQYLPFDPPLVERGATLGGTTAAGLSGSGRYHYGGLRDFLLGVRFVDGQGQLVRGGGKVVKNAAGFDLPKLMVGSLGRLGAMVELSFKVFPRPEAFATLRATCADLDTALNIMKKITAARLDIDALDLEPTSKEYLLWIRLGGLAAALPARLERLKDLLSDHPILEITDEERIWQQARELSWAPGGWSLIKAPLTPARMPALEASLRDKPVLRRYLAGGQMAWLALEGPPAALEGLLEEQELAGLAIFGPPGAPRLGQFMARSFYQRVKSALDPNHRFAEV
ncbi:MAG: FAD-binding protein [Anaerolineales bacterium]|nr:FAD-binding protein [Anaerolineales bacterium]